MLSVYSPMQIETTSSFPFHTEMRSSLSSHSHNQQQQLSHHDRDQQSKQQQNQPSPRPSASQSTADWKLSSSTHPSSNSTPPNSKSSTTSTDPSSDQVHSYYSNSRTNADHPAVKVEAMIPTQTQQAASQPIYSAPFYSSTDYSPMKTITPHFSSTYMSPYASHSRPTIHDRRQSMMAHGKAPNTPPSSSDARSRGEYSSQGHPTLSEEVSSTVHASQPPPGSWDPAQSSTQPPVQSLHDSHARGIDSYSAVQPNLPPLSEALHGLSSASSPSMAVSPPMQAQQATFSTMGNVIASPPNFYAPNPYLEMQAPVSVYPPQDQFDNNDTSKMQQSQSQDRHASMDSNTAPSSGYVRRVTYPFVPSLENGAGLVMSGVIPSSEPSGSSPLISNSSFTHGGLVGAGPVSVQGMARGSPQVDYVDSLTLQQQVHQAPSHHHAHAHHHAQAQAAAAAAAGMHPIAAWPQNGSDMGSVDGSVNGSKTYSFVPLSGVNSKKRPRRRFDEIERLYVCSWGDCEKAYGTLNHLNAHVNMQKHGPKRLPAEFKELRKAWRKHKRAEEEAAKQAAAFHQQQNQTQQAQLQQQHQQQPLCDPVLTAHMQQVGHHPLAAMHAMTHHQPHQLPHPHAHPNQHAHPHHSQSQHHHPMGF